MTKETIDKAEVLIQALPYIQKYRGKYVVVKYGGAAMLNEELKSAVMKDITLLSQIGIKIILVHGGGPEITAMLKRVGKESKFLNGLRVTDAETAEIAQMVLAGKVNKDLVAFINSVGGKAVGLCGTDGGLIKPEKISNDLGFVGEVKSVDTSLITELLGHGYIPIISTVGADESGQVYNINADTAATAIATALNAENIIFMTDIKGLLKDVNDENSLIPHVTLGEVPKLIKQGIISGGMIPKVECCENAVKQGVKKAVMIDGRIPHAILIEMLSDEGAGTLFEEKQK